MQQLIRSSQHSLLSQFTCPPPPLPTQRQALPNFFLLCQQFREPTFLLTAVEHFRCREERHSCFVSASSSKQNERDGAASSPTWRRPCWPGPARALACSPWRWRTTLWLWRAGSPSPDSLLLLLVEPRSSQGAAEAETEILGKVSSIIVIVVTDLQMSWTSSVKNIPLLPYLQSIHWCHL